MREGLDGEAESQALSLAFVSANVLTQYPSCEQEGGLSTKCQEESFGVIVADH